MGKRKRRHRSQSPAELRKRLKKINKELKVLEREKKARRNRRDSRSASEYRSSRERSASRSSYRDSRSPSSRRSVRSDSDSREASPASSGHGRNSRGSSRSNSSRGNASYDDENKENNSLAVEVLNILGEHKVTEKSYDAPLREEIVVRWGTILKNGLFGPDKSNILDKYQFPTNFKELEAPKLNLEVASVVTDSVKSRDNKLLHVQNQIGKSMSAIGKALSLVLKKEGGGDLSIIQYLSDAGKLLADVHLYQSSTRRDLVSMNLNKELKETMNDVNLDGWLFGNNLEDRVKATQNLEKCGQILKPQKPKQLDSKKPSVPLNSKSLPRFQQNTHRGRQKQQFRSSYHQRSQFQQKYRNNRYQRPDQNNRYQRPPQSSRTVNRRYI